MRKHLLWRLCLSAVLVLSALTFTPLVMPTGTYRPTAWGLPYTLWTGLLVTLALIALTYMATRVFPPEDDRSAP